MQLGGAARHLHGGIGAELPRGIHNPAGAKAPEKDAFGGFADSCEIRLHILHAPEHHAGGNRDFSVIDVLPYQFFREFSGDKGVIFRIAQK